MSSASPNEICSPTLRVRAVALAITLILSINPTLHAGWTVQSDKSRIVYSAETGKGYATFEMALKVLAASGRINELDSIFAHALLTDDNLQRELFAELKRSSPRELKEALASSGNMHNPKMHQLWKPFEMAFRATPTISRLNASLAGYGLTSRPAMEKFELRKSAQDPEPRFHGFLWLVVGKNP